MTKRRRSSANRMVGSPDLPPFVQRRRTVHETIPTIVGTAFVLVLVFALSWGRDGPVGAGRGLEEVSSPTASEVR